MVRAAAKQAGNFEKIPGTVEVDETFVGGIEKNKDTDKKLRARRSGIVKMLVLRVLEQAKTVEQSARSEYRLSPICPGRGFTS